jgi:acetylornithine deacetylase/succinyl-diaminopimelate desuccinylase-like protein
MSCALHDPIAEILSWLTRLIAAPTAYPPGDTSQIARELHTALSEMGYKSQTHTFAPLLANVVAKMGSGSPSLVFNVHLDTVGPGDLSRWTRSPFLATVQNGFVYGLGASNCKGSAAIQLWVAQQIAMRGGPARGQVVFTFVTDEESLDANGMSALRTAGVASSNTWIARCRCAWAVGSAGHAGNESVSVEALRQGARILEQLVERLLGYKHRP